jgi:rare lipoprotein A
MHEPRNPWRVAVPIGVEFMMTNQNGAARLRGRAALAGTLLALSAAPALAGSAAGSNKVQGEGIASFYGGRHHGGPTASGERFNMHAMTAAHRTAPLGSRLLVTNLRNGKSVVVRINDRGPFIKGRIIDLSRGAADVLGFTGAGLTRVAVTAADGRAKPFEVASLDIDETGSTAKPAETRLDAEAGEKPVLTDAERLMIDRTRPTDR